MSRISYFSYTQHTHKRFGRRNCSHNCIKRRWESKQSHVHTHTHTQDNAFVLTDKEALSGVQQNGQQLSVCDYFSRIVSYPPHILSLHPPTLSLFSFSTNNETIICAFRVRNIVCLLFH